MTTTQTQTLPEIKDIISEESIIVDIDSSIKEAMKFYESGNYNDALTNFRSVDETTTTFNKHLFIGNCLYKLNILDEAKTEWLKATKLFKDSASAYVNLGNLHYRQSETNRAIRYWHKALLREPESEVANYNIAISYSKKECRDLAITYFRKFLKYYHSDYSEPNYCKVKEFMLKIESRCEIYIQKAAEFLEKKDFDKVVENYLKTLYNNPCEYKISNFLGLMYFKVRNYPKALEYHLLAYRNDPEHRTSIMNIALAFDKLEYPNYAYCYYRRILPYLATGSDKYMSVIKLIQKISPEVAGKNEYINHHIKMAQDYEANTLYQQALEEYENTIFILNNTKKEISEKIAKMRRYTNPEKDIISNLLNKLDENFGQGEYEKAITYCNRIILLSKENSREYDTAYNRRNTAKKRLGIL